MRFSRSAGFEVVDLGRADYQVVHQRMLDLVERISAKVSVTEVPDHLLVAEFEPVLTVGRGARLDRYQGLGLPVHAASRGGRATFHGPGQLVAYPLIRLGENQRDLHALLHCLEEALIATVAEFGLSGGRDPRNTGCWVDGRKIASIGLAVRRWVTYHGVALNVTTDLSWFRRFDPCGLEPDIMTTMEQELGSAPPLGAVKAALIRNLQQQLRHEPSS